MGAGREATLWLAAARIVVSTAAVLTVQDVRALRMAPPPAAAAAVSPA